MFSNSFRDQGGGYSNLNEFSNSIPSFDGSHIVESTFLWIKEVYKLFDMEYIPMEDHVKFVDYKLKGGITTWCEQFPNMCMYQGKPPLRTWSRRKRLLQARNFTLEEEEMEN